MAEAVARRVDEFRALTTNMIDELKALTASRERSSVRLFFFSFFTLNLLQITEGDTLTSTRLALMLKAANRNVFNALEAVKVDWIKKNLSHHFRSD